MADNKAKALEEKEKGNAAYKKKDFEAALTHYGKAFELDPTNITFLTNKGAVYFEQSNFEECIKTCTKAVEVGRENKADFKLIAKAFARIGNAYLRQDDLPNALKYFNKSVSEDRVPDVVKKIEEIEQKLERLAYLDPELSLQEKTKGNEAFKEGKYPDAIHHYTEAIKRNPDDAKIYSNRAACYTKVMEFPLALKDCESCIKLDPDFLKGYLRKGAVLLAMKDPTKASVAYRKALDIDPNCTDALEGYKKAMMAESEDPEAVKQKAMSNPEVQKIISDPTMQHILGLMSSDPEAAKKELKKPEVAADIQKLMEMGKVAAA